MSALRFLATRRWELLLFFGIPAGGEFARILALVGFGLLDYTGPDFLGQLIEAGGSAALLGASYVYVRRQGRWFLSLIWGYLLTVTALSALLVVIWAAWLSAPGVSVTSEPLWPIVPSLFALALYLPVTLWFARQASRSSLAHAFFLVLVVELVAGGGNPAGRFVDAWIYELSGSSLDMSIVSGLASFTFYLAAGALGVWLLGSFELRGSVFRRRAVYGALACDGYGWLHPGLIVLAVYGWSAPTHLDQWHLWLAFLGLLGAYVATIALTLALVYLARARQPSPQGEKA